MNKKLKMIAGLDIGNGYVKGKIKINDAKTQVMNFPASVSYTVSNIIPRPIDRETIDDIYNRLDVNMSSKGIKQRDEGRVLVGQRGINSGESQMEFNIENQIPKSEDSLATMLILSSIAGSALQYFYKKFKQLPETTLKVDVYAGLALPIENYLDYRKSYENLLLDDLHFVTVNNFETKVNVEISFKKVVVLPEGAAAQYAITSLGSKFLQDALDASRAQGAIIDKAYTGDVLSKVMNTIGIDVGEGTTNFPVFVNGNISIESSRSINKGYGTVLRAVMAELRNTEYAFDSRKSLSEFMQQKDYLPAQRAIANEVQKLLDKHTKILVKDIMNEFSNIYRKVGIRTEAVYVYGGGATAIQKFLYPALINAVKITDEQSLPVIYLDSSYSRDLNRNGLFEGAELASKSR